MTLLRKIISKTLFQTLFYALGTFVVRGIFSKKRRILFPRPPKYIKKRKSTSRGRLWNGNATLKKQLSTLTEHEVRRMRTLTACTLMNVDFHQFWTRALDNISKKLYNRTFRGSSASVCLGLIATTIVTTIADFNGLFDKPETDVSPSGLSGHCRL